MVWCALLWVLVGTAWSGVASSSSPESAFTIGPYLQSLGTTSVEIRFETSAARSTEVTIGSQRVTTKEGTKHVASFTGLAPHTHYTYEAHAGDAIAKGELVTAPKDDTTEPFSFITYGDNRTDDQGHAAVVQSITKTPSDFLVHTGDFLGDSRSEQGWVKFFSIEQALLRDRCLFAAIGNHDVLDDGEHFKRFFGAFNQTMRWQFARFWFVNAQDNSPHDWLLPNLAAHDGEAGIVWRIVVLHQGPYSSGPHGSNSEIRKSDLEQWRTHKVDLVISGHDHIYERGADGLLRYVVSGGGGAPPYPLEGLLPQSRKAEAVRHFVEVRLTTNDVHLSARRIDGTVIDESSFTKAIAWADDKSKDVAKAAATAENAEPAKAKESSSSWIPAMVVGGILLLLLVGQRLYRKKE